MKATLVCLILISWIIPAQGASWSEDFSSPTKGRWLRYGKIESQPQGLRLGFVSSDWEESGLRTTSSIGNPDNGIKITLQFEDFKIAHPAQKQAAEDRENGDMSVNIQLSTEGQSTFYNSKHPGAIVNLFYNGDENMLWGCVRAKAGGIPRSSGTCLGSQMLPNSSGQAKVKVILRVTGNSISVNFLVDEQSSWLWSGTLPEKLGTAAVLNIFQQNIREGRGTCVLTGMTVESVSLTGR